MNKTIIEHIKQFFGNDIHFSSEGAKAEAKDILVKINENNKPENLHVFRVIYLPHSSTQAARVKIISERFKQSIIVSYHADEFEDCRDAQEIAVKHLTSLGYNITSIGEGWDCMYVISDTLEPLKK